MTLPAVQHARLGASKAERWWNCPGTIRMSQGIEEVQSEFAIEGSAAHQLGERVLASIDVDCADFIGDTIELPPRKGVVHTWVVDEDMARAVQEYVDYVFERKLALSATMYLERTFDLSPLDPPGEMYGTADCVLLIADGRFIEVIDYKHGVGVVVDATENKQLMYYALGALLALQQDGLLKQKPERMKITIVQPRGFHRDGPIRSYEFTYDELVGFKKELFERAEMTLDPNAPLAVGPWCRFCPALATCPEQKSHAIEVAQSEFDALRPPPPERLTLDEITIVLNKASIIEDWVRSIRAHVQTMLEAGEEVPGWKLVPRRASRKWKSGQEPAVIDFAVEHGVDEDDLYLEPKLKSPAQVEKELKAKLPRGRKKEAANLLEASGLVVKESSGNTIAPTSDARPAVTGTTAADEFTALPAGDDTNQ